jgi:hypothetical protein
MKFTGKDGHGTQWNKMADIPGNEGTQPRETRWRIFPLTVVRTTSWNKVASAQPRETRWRIFLLTKEHTTSWNKMADFTVDYRAHNLVNQDGGIFCWL